MRNICEWKWAPTFGDSVCPTRSPWIGLTRARCYPRAVHYRRGNIIRSCLLGTRTCPSPGLQESSKYDCTTSMAYWCSAVNLRFALRRRRTVWVNKIRIISFDYFVLFIKVRRSGLFDYCVKMNNLTLVICGIISLVKYSSRVLQKYFFVPTYYILL